MYEWRDLYRPMLDRIRTYGFSPRVADIDQIPSGPGPHLAILAQAPAKDECEAYAAGRNVDTYGTVLVGPSGVFLEAAFHFSNTQRNRCYMTNIFPFEMPDADDFQIKVSEIDYVASHVREKLARFPVVLCLGKEALRVYTSIQESIIDLCGSVIVTETGQKIVPSIHPSYAVKAHMSDEAGKLGDESIFWYLVLALKNAFGLLEDRPVFEASDSFKPYVVNDIKLAREWLGDQLKGSIDALDFEATSTNPYLSGLPVCGAMSADGQGAMIIPFKPWYPFATITFNDFLRLLEEMNHIDLGMHNLLYDYSLMTRFGYRGKPPVVDTMYLTHSGIEFIPKSLKFLSAFFCKIQPYSFPHGQLEGYYRGGSYAQYEYWLLHLLRYNGIDAIATRLLMNVIPKIFGKDWERVHNVYLEYVHPLLLDLHRTSRNGVILNQDVLETVRKVVVQIITDAERDFRTFFPGIKNMRSPKEVGKAFGGIAQQFPGIIRTTKAGNVSMDKFTLQALTDKGVQSAKTLLTYRKASKQLTTYVDAYPQYLDSEGLIHTQFGLTKTSRLKSQDPALQTLPRKSDILGLFTADFGFPPYDWIFIKPDISAGEARLLAFYCGIKALLDPTVDVHKLSAMHFFEILLEDVTAELRQTTKNLTFGVIYGAAARRLAILIYGNDSEENIKKAQALLNKFFEKFPEIKVFMNCREMDIRTKGFVEMPKGLRRHFPVECLVYRLTGEESSPWGQLGRRLGWRIFQKAIREGYNFWPQGGIAYLTNTALMNTNKKFDAEQDPNWLKYLSTVNLQVHDSLVIRAHKTNFVKSLTLLKEAIVAPIMGDVIIPVDFPIGWNLKDQVEIVSASDSVKPLDWNKIESNLERSSDLLQFVREAREIAGV
jgi:uracil-DNA glycosylase family 4